MQLHKTMPGILATFAAVSPAAAAIITLDADGFAQGTDISDAFAGVTLSSVGSSSLDGQIYAYTDSARASTGTNVFAFRYQGSSVFPYWRNTTRILRADFDSPVSEVLIDMIGNDNSDRGILKAYSSIGVLLDWVLSPQLVDGQEWQARIDRPAADIAYILAAGFNGRDVHLDNLSVTPEPATLALLAMGGVPLAYGGRRSLRRKKAMKRVVFMVSFLSLLTLSLTSSTARADVFDWQDVRGQECMTPATDEGSCGSCWVSAVVTTAEAKSDITKDDPDLDLSKQHLILNGSTGNCWDAWKYRADDFLLSNGVVDPESLDPSLQTYGTAVGAVETREDWFWTARASVRDVAMGSIMDPIGKHGCLLAPTEGHATVHWGSVLQNSFVLRSARGPAT